MSKAEVFRNTVPQNISTKAAAVMNDDIITAFDGNCLLGEGQRNR